MYILSHEVSVNHYPLTPFGYGVGGHWDHKFLAVRPFDLKHIACAEIFDCDAFAEVGAVGRDTRQTKQVAEIIFAFAERRQRFTRHGQDSAAQLFRCIAVTHFGEARDCAVFGGAQRFYRQRAVIEAFVPFQAVHVVREQLETDFTRHAVRAGNGGERDGVDQLVFWQRLSPRPFLR
jgi:hypothetical protein